MTPSRTHEAGLLARGDRFSQAHFQKFIGIAGPSGSGKTTIIQHLLATTSLFSQAISHTTRKPRVGEVHGRDYYFIDNEKFISMEAHGLFMESAQVFGNSYGTSHSSVQHIFSQGKNAIKAIDVKGCAQLRVKDPHAVLIFITPSDSHEIERRLRGRGTDTEEVIQRRLQEAVYERSCSSEFSYLVYADHVQDAAADILAIVRAESLRMIKS